MKYNLFYAGYDFNSKIEQVGFLSSNDFSNWIKSEKDPLASVLEVEGYTDEQTSNPCVISVDGLYKMWYQAKSKDSIFSVMYAESKDLKNWIFLDKPVLSLGKGEGFRYGIQHPHVLYENGLYKMWFTLTRNSGSVFGYAESNNGMDWVIKNENVFSPDLNWEGGYLLYPMVLKDNDKYKLWYAAKSNSSFFSIGYAESINGIIWKKEKKPVISYKVLPKIFRRGFEFLCKIFHFDLRIPLYGIASPCVWKENNKYFLIGHEVGTHGKLYIAMFESFDGKKWIKINDNILKNVKLENWEEFFQGDPYLYVQS